MTPNYLEQDPDPDTIIYFQAKEVQRTGKDPSKARGTTPSEGFPDTALSCDFISISQGTQSYLFHFRGFSSITNSLRV